MESLVLLVVVLWLTLLAMSGTAMILAYAGWHFSGIGLAIIAFAVSLSANGGALFWGPPVAAMVFAAWCAIRDERTVQR